MCRLFERYRDIHELEARSFEDNLPCCSELCKCSGKDLSVLSVKIAQIVSKTATQKLNIAV